MLMPKSIYAYPLVVLDYIKTVSKTNYHIYSSKKKSPCKILEKGNLHPSESKTHVNKNYYMISCIFSFTQFVQMVFPSQVPIPVAQLQLPAFEPSPCPIPTSSPNKNTQQMNINYLPKRIGKITLLIKKRSFELNLQHYQKERKNCSIKSLRSSTTMQLIYLVAFFFYEYIQQPLILVFEQDLSPLQSQSLTPFKTELQHLCQVL